MVLVSEKVVCAPMRKKERGVGYHYFLRNDPFFSKMMTSIPVFPVVDFLHIMIFLCFTCMSTVKIIVSLYSNLTYHQMVGNLDKQIDGIKLLHIVDL